MQGRDKVKESQEAKGSGQSSSMFPEQNIRDLVLSCRFCLLQISTQFQECHSIETLGSLEDIQDLSHESTSHFNKVKKLEKYVK